MDGDGPILVTGATGDIGGGVVRLLQEAGEPVRAMCRRPDQVEAFRARGVDAVLGDLGRPRTLTTAMAGVDRLFLLTNPDQAQAAYGRNAVHAAAAAGVRRVVHLSTADADAGSAIPWAAAPAHTDAMIAASGMAWTSLKPTGFMKNFLASAQTIRLGFLPQTSGDGAAAWIDTEDIAAVAGRVLSEDGHEGRAYVLTGPELLTMAEVGDRIGAVLGRRVRYVHLPAPVFAAVLRLGGTEAWEARGLVRQFVDVVRNGHGDGRARTDDVQRITGRPPRSLTEFAREHRDEFLAA